ncbi:sugar phosphate isomerase/epimerase family protein [Coralloluteibacterium stylophorae]|uniref:Sugar phosphate isomerase/epimerase n=1 Tax=Coralloluteibacterium stylophorae TaxID=1776034 RepID=A0A8J8AYP8_9GAMM|nr:sugar phosphate isomerase/epimerase family protein [Coralloluteibacterium stylophorae]MBS7457178.1 sugar phosphate isomerase/epimerase [Coralloluteibacterium stylophorae]
MTIGICTWTLGLDDLDTLMDRVTELGFDGVQINDLWESYSVADIKDAIERRGLSLIAVDAQRIAPQDAPNLERGLEAYRHVIEVASQLGAPYVTLPILSAWVQGLESPFDALVEGCRSLADYAAHVGESGPKLVYEVVNRKEVPMIFTAEEGNRLLAAVGRKNVGLILDSYHMHLEEDDPVAAIEGSRDTLSIYHISDSTRGGIGSGNVDFRAQFEALVCIGFQGPVVMECLPPMHEPSSPVTSEGDRSILEEEYARSLEVWRDYAASVACARAYK